MPRHLLRECSLPARAFAARLVAAGELCLSPLAEEWFTVIPELNGAGLLTYLGGCRVAPVLAEGR